MYKKKTEVSQGAVEFALILPLLLFIIFGVIEIGHLTFIYVTVLNAAREAARYGAASGTISGTPHQYEDCSGIANTAVNINTIANFNSNNVTIYYDSGPNTSQIGPCSSLNATDWQSVGTGSRIVVTVSAPYTPIVPIIPVPSFNLSATSRHTILSSVAISGTVVAPPVATAGTLSITNLNPETGSTAGNYSVAIYGTGFDSTSTVTFPGATCTIGSSVQINCTLAAHSAGYVTVKVATTTGFIATYNGFEYVTPPAPSSISPATGTTAGQTVVTINGSNFTDPNNPTNTPSVTFGTLPCLNVNVVSSSQLTCSTPAQVAGTVNVVVAISGVQSTNSVVYTYADPISITGVAPNTGSSGGGTPVVITGTNLLNTTVVTFGGVTATGCVTNATLTQLSCTTPAHAIGTVDVMVNNSGLTATLSGGYTYTYSPAITSVSPGYGPTSNNTTKTITLSIIGNNFVNGATTVTLGSGTCSIVSVTITKIICTTPQNAIQGAVDITVTAIVGGTSYPYTLIKGFTYLDPPTVTLISPAYGAIAGGNSVTITGTNFVSGYTTVTIGGNNCPVTSAIGTQLVCTVPASTLSGTKIGAVPVVVTVQTLNPVTVNNGYNYTGLTVSSISPAFGPLVGGTTLTITGTGFVTGSTSVTVGGTACANLTVVSTTQITCTTPSTGTAGPVTVAVTTITGGTAPTPLAFTYTDTTFTSMSPRNGSVSGGYTVTLTGTNFTGLNSVTFGGNVATGCSVNGDGTQITCTVPAATVTSSPSTVDVAVTVTNPSTGISTTAKKAQYFSYDMISTMAVTSIVPNYGPVAGGTSITINGTGLAGMSSVKIGNTTASGTCVVNGGGTQITGCITPAGTAGAADVTVITSTNGSATLGGGYTYTTVTISSLSPNSGSAGTTVTLIGTNLATGTTPVSFGGVGISCTTTSTTPPTTNTVCTIPTISSILTNTAVDVVVTSQDGPITLSGAFTYYPPCTLANINPGIGSISGGSGTWTLSGTNLGNLTSVYFGGPSWLGTCSSLSSLTVVCSALPAHPAGTVTVTVNTSTNGSCSLDGFVYQTIVATNTPTPTITLTPPPTDTPTATPTNTPVATDTPIPGTCSPVTTTFTAPFTYNGAGTFCWQTSTLGSYINSWNLNSLTINGVNIVNSYVTAYPAKINGYWYILYNGSYSYSHFETK